MSPGEDYVGRRTVENHIPTTSPYCLPKPPVWFLDELYAFDPALRIFASVSDPLYRIMRAMTVSMPWTTFLQNKPDTKIAVRHKLYPVTSVNPSTLLGFSWGRVLLDLAERDQWAFKNAAAVARHREESEARQDQRIISGQTDEADQRAIDMYRAYQGMNGSRTSHAYRAPDGARSGKTRLSSARPRPAYRPRNSGAGAFFTGRGLGAAAMVDRPAPGRIVAP